MILLFCAVDGIKYCILHHLILLCLLICVENVPITVFSKCILLQLMALPTLDREYLYLQNIHLTTRQLVCEYTDNFIW